MLMGLNVVLQQAEILELWRKQHDHWIGRKRFPSSADQRRTHPHFHARPLQVHRWSFAWHRKTNRTHSSQPWSPVLSRKRHQNVPPPNIRSLVVQSPVQTVDSTVYFSLLVIYSFSVMMMWRCWPMREEAEGGRENRELVPWKEEGEPMRISMRFVVLIRIFDMIKIEPPLPPSPRPLPLLLWWENKDVLTAAEPVPS